MKKILKKILKKNVFDKDGNLISDFSKLSFPIELFDERGNLIYEEDDIGNWETWEYDERENLIYWGESEYGGIWEKYEYDENGNKIYEEDSDGEIRKFDKNGKQIYFKDSDGRCKKSEYDENGNLISHKKFFDTDIYGEVIVNYAMIEDDFNTLHDGLEIHLEDGEYIQVLEYFDVDELTSEKVENLIDRWM